MLKNKSFYVFIAFLLLFFIKQHVYSNNDFEPLKYWITFKDKNFNDYSIDNPQEFLSQRSIERRSRQNIPIDSTDLPVSRVYLDSLLTDTSITLIHTSKWLNAALFEIPEKKSLDFINNLSFVEDVTYVKPRIEEDHISIISNSFKNKDIVSKSVIDNIFINEKVNRSYNNSDYGFAENQIKIFNGQALHEKGFFGEGKIITLLDAGYTNLDKIDYFQHLWENNQIIGWRDFVNPEHDIFDVHRHGTLVLSVMAAMKPNVFKGVAPKSKYLLLRSEDTESEFLIEECNWLVAAEYADSIGTDIINSSLGYTRFDDPAQDHTYESLDGQTTIVSQAANHAFNKGILVVNSAGNYATREWQYIGAPADSFGALSVGAVDNNGDRAFFSSVGPTYDGRIKPDIMAVGLNAAAVDKDGEMIYANGTSFSSPLIAGMAACLWEAFPDKKAKDIKKAIIKSSHRAFAPDTLYGFGIPDFGKAYNLLKSDFIVDDPEIKVYPNPFINDFNISMYLNIEKEVKVSLFNTTGQRLHNENYNVNKGFNNININNTTSLASGIFVLVIEGDQINYRTKILKK